ncbi:MFS transporter [Salipiger mangrovisoli]|uniref:MFS transporter n=1 Tax=Salipiger mangrovisoli TaxID=2865933 RepID=A0ABR9X487_9RHOB|nr:MFS transporter [Salipiger mangrovisoli]MBE9638382.1 MFS transporter [Salipiger mangrovisoli]
MLPKTSPLRHSGFRRLFAAQILSLLGIGVMTVSLSLSAYAVGGTESGGTILGGILGLKMIAYVLIAPLAEALLSRLPRRGTLVALDLARLALVGAMGLAGGPWQIAALAFVFFAVSAGFTPLFQSVLPDMLPEPERYSRALALSRLAYTLESILSPVIAGAALLLLAASDLFFLASACFAGSALLLVLTAFPAGVAPLKAPFLDRLGKGVRIFIHTPRLRGLFVLNVALSLVMAWVIVDTVVFAGARLGDAERHYTRLMAAYGVGAALGALAVPRLVAWLEERLCMAAGVIGFALLGGVLALLPGLPMAGLLALWAGFGAVSSLVLTPGGLVLARSAQPGDRPAVFAAQFSLSHAGWLLAYPLAGWLGAALAPEHALGILGLAAAAGALMALRVWPARDPLARAHDHPELPGDHPHLQEHPVADGGHRHAHDYRIDALHPRWPEVG